MRSKILLIGPLCAGKSTVGGLLAEHLSLPQCSIDELPLQFFTDLGLNPERLRVLKDTEGALAAYRYMQEFGVRAVEAVLAERERQIIDFGAPYSVYEDDSLLERVKKAFASHSNVVLLLPSPDLDESTRIVKERMAERIKHTELRRLLLSLRDETGVDYEELYVKHASNFQLARLVVYTEGRTPSETRDEIITRLGLEP